MVRCPYCNFEGEFKVLKTWKFRFYNVTRLRCPNCKGFFNYYNGISPKDGRILEFVIRTRSYK